MSDSRRHASLALAAAVGVVLGAAPASARAQATVEVVPLTGPTQTVSLDAMAGSEDVQGRAYAVRSVDGETTQTVTGFSLGAVLEQAGVDVFTFSYVKIPRAAGGSVLLSNEAARASATAESGPPAVFVDGQATGFVRPSSGAEDLNGPDSFSASPLVVRLRSGSLIEIEASASATKVDPKERVTFSVEAQQAGSGQELTYSWSFDDGETARGDKVAHVFAKPGTYDVVVGATAADDKTGGDDVVTVVVGEPRESGPDRRGGGTNKNEDAPDSGQARGASGPGDTSGAPGVPSSGDGGAGPSGDDATAGATEQRSAAPAQRTRENGPAGVRIVGELLSAEQESPLDQGADAPEDEPVAARTGQLAESADSAWAGSALGAVTVALLLGIGALREGQLVSAPSPPWRRA